MVHGAQQLLTTGVRFSTLLVTTRNDCTGVLGRRVLGGGAFGQMHHKKPVITFLRACWGSHTDLQHLD